jgi:hypothetical protein
MVTSLFGTLNGTDGLFAGPNVAKALIVEISQLLKMIRMRVLTFVFVEVSFRRLDAHLSSELRLETIGYVRRVKWTAATIF